MFVELNEQDMESTFQNEVSRQAYFFHTPLCGTCQLARRMCDVAIAALPNVEVYSCNVNFFPRSVKKWEITSIPALVIARGGQVLERLYAFESVQTVYAFLTTAAPRPS